MIKFLTQIEVPFGKAHKKRSKPYFIPNPEATEASFRVKLVVCKSSITWVKGSNRGFDSGRSKRSFNNTAEMHERIFYLGVLCVVVGFASFGKISCE